MANEENRNPVLERIEREARESDASGTGLMRGASFAPDRFYLWPLWKKLAFTVAGGVVLFGVAILYILVRRLIRYGTI